MTVGPSARPGINRNQFDHSLHFSLRRPRSSVVPLRSLARSYRTGHRPPRDHPSPRPLDTLPTQDAHRGVSRVYAARAGGSSVVLGYYTLSATRLSRKSLPEKEAKRLPHYPIPAALLRRLAVDRSCQGYPQCQ